ncbi:MAG TPA: hypothetical protein VF517_03725 [Thermoleophilaceae bacterium]|jgi:microcystin degradation protein MlrC
MSESDLREFIREQSLIANRRTDAFVKEISRQREEMRLHFEKQDRKIDEMVAEGKAGRAALFAILDRLDNGGPATAG